MKFLPSRQPTGDLFRWPSGYPDKAGRRSPTRIAVVLGTNSLRDPTSARGVNTSRGVDAPPRAPAMLAGLKSQAHRCDATGDIETDAAFDADRL
jgi:hypothetical protein